MIGVDKDLKSLNGISLSSWRSCKKAKKVENPSFRASTKKRLCRKQKSYWGMWGWRGTPSNVFVLYPNLFVYTRSTWRPVGFLTLSAFSQTASYARRLKRNTPSKCCRVIIWLRAQNCRVHAFVQWFNNYSKLPNSCNINISLSRCLVI